MIVLGLDTSCDETSVAILDRGKILSNVISSQIKLHAPHGGVVPELASRAHAENIKQVVDQALLDAKLTLKDIQGIAVTQTPGLIGCLLVGLSYAKTLSMALNVPLTTVHHLKGHLFSSFIEQTETIPYPFLGLVVSGGHSTIYEVKNFNSITPLGYTVDDAAGEAYDKIAKMLSLGYPGGPLVDRLAQKGVLEKRGGRFQFTVPRVKKGPYHFSFSGLKTAVWEEVKKFDLQKPDKNAKNEFILDLATDFQKMVVHILLGKLKKTIGEFKPNAIALSGGVACNSLLKSEFTLLAKKERIQSFIPPPALCTDNAAMIAYIGEIQLAAGKQATLDANAFATLPIF